MKFLKKLFNYNTAVPAAAAAAAPIIPEVVAPVIQKPQYVDFINPYQNPDIFTPPETFMTPIGTPPPIQPMPNMSSYLSGLGKNAKSLTRRAYQGIGDAYSGLGANAQSLTRRAYQGIGDAYSGLGANAQSLTRRAYQGIGDAYSGLGAQLGNVYTDLNNRFDIDTKLNNAYAGLTTGLDYIKTNIGQIDNRTLLIAFGAVAISIATAYLISRQRANSKKNLLNTGNPERDAIINLVAICLSENNAALANSIAGIDKKEKIAAVKQCVNEKYNAINGNMFASEDLIDKVLDELCTEGIF